MVNLVCCSSTRSGTRQMCLRARAHAQSSGGVRMGSVHDLPGENLAAAAALGRQAGPSTLRE